MGTMIIGGGYAGVMAANRLAGKGEAVKLVSSNPWFVERIRLHSVASGARPHAHREFASLLHPNVTVVHATAIQIDDHGEHPTVHFDSGETQSCDTLIYSVGSDAPRPAGIHRVTTESAAEQLRDDLENHPEDSVTVVGAGLTGIELSGALRAAGRKVTLRTASLPARRSSRAHVQALRRNGVEVVIGDYVDLGLPHEGIMVDTTGFSVAGLARDSGLPTDPQGRLIVDETLTVPGHPHILGAGDAVLVTGQGEGHLRAACATALPMGAHVADVVLARKRGTTPRAFGMGYFVQCVDLGNGRGRAQIVHADDSERHFAISGRVGGLIKELISRSTVRSLISERGHAGRFRWPAPPKPAPD